jgi:uncharacterized protein YegJ (DUF2314 family)
VQGAVFSKNVVARTAFAVASAIAEATGDLVYDQLCDRIERPGDFAARAIVSPLSSTAFRADRIDVRYAPRDDGTVRLLTAGMLRFGAPDVEASSIRVDSARRLADVLLASAAAIADGASSSPLSLSIADVERARSGNAEPALVESPTHVKMENVHPESGDPNDVMARIVPEGGTTPDGYAALATAFFGEPTPETPNEEEMRAHAERARAKLPELLARLSTERDAGARLFVQLPFPIAGDAGTEWMWVEVSRFDDRTVTGALADDPLGAVGLRRGSTVTRPRSEVSDLSWRHRD